MKKITSGEFKGCYKDKRGNIYRCDINLQKRIHVGVKKQKRVRK